MPQQHTIPQLEYLLQEERARYAKLLNLSKGLIDAAIDYEKHRNNVGDVKQKKFLILKNREKALRDYLYPKQNGVSQAKLDWLGQ